MTFNPFVQQTRPTDAFPVLISLLVLHAAPYNLAQKCTSLRPIISINSAPVCCELMELLGYLRFPAQISTGCNVKIWEPIFRRTPCLESFDYVCRHEWSEHAHKFAAPWVHSFGCCGRKNDFLLNIWRPIVHALFHWLHPGLFRRVCLDGIYKRSKFQLNRMNNKGVIRGQSFRHSLPTLDCKFEPNVTFTDRDETGARRKVWTNESLGPSAQNFLSPLFRVMAPESWYLLMFDP